MTRAVANLLALHNRRINPPPHLRYPWQRAKEPRRGAAIVDPEAWDKAWREAMPVDAFNATNYQTKG